MRDLLLDTLAHIIEGTVMGAFIVTVWLAAGYLGGSL